MIIIVIEIPDRNMKKRYKLKWQYGLENTILLFAIVLVAIPLIVYCIFFRSLKISNDPRDWENFLIVLYSLLILIATVVLGYFVHKLNKRNTIKPLQYQAYNNFLMNLENEINVLQKIKEDDAISLIMDTLFSFRVKYYKFLAYDGFLFGVKALNDANGYQNRLNYIINQCNNMLADDVHSELKFEIKIVIFDLISNITASLKFALAGYDIIDLSAKIPNKNNSYESSDF